MKVGYVGCLCVNNRDIDNICTHDNASVLYCLVARSKAIFAVVLHSFIQSLRADAGILF
jgi:hypothetical protein